MTLLGFDISHFQPGVNFAAAKAAGRSFVVLKATDGIGYTDPTFAANRKAAHAAGLVVGIYAFARGGNAVNEAAYFCGVVGALQPNEFLVLDWECSYSGDHVSWCKAWLYAVHQRTGVAPLIYMNQSEMAGHNWSPVSGTYGLWLAKYDNSTAAPTTSSWSAAAMKQYSDKGSVLGVSGPVDVDVFYGDLNALAAYCTGGTDMPLNDADKAWISELVRPMSDSVTPGIAGVKFDGYVYSEAKAAHAAAQAAVDGIAKVAAPVVDAKALAAALVADSQAVGTLADALATAIAKRLGNG